MDVGDIYYNGVLIPGGTDVRRVISAYPGANPLDPGKITRYEWAIRMGNKFPPIMGYPTELIDLDIREQNGFYLCGEPILPQHVGEVVWVVTNGHHRTIAHYRAGIYRISVEIDPGTFTREDELEAYRAMCRRANEIHIDTVGNRRLG